MYQVSGDEYLGHGRSLVQEVRLVSQCLSGMRATSIVLQCHPNDQKDSSSSRSLQFHDVITKFGE